MPRRNRPDRRRIAPDPIYNSDAVAKFDKSAEELRARGGGVISIYYHPTEFVTTEFWDGVNFARGASRERARRCRHWPR